MEFELGQKIRKIRELKGFSQEYMAERLDISQKVYSNIENDKRKLDKEILEKIAGVLEIHPNDLLSFDDRMLFYSCDKPAWYMKSVIHGLPDKERKLYEERIDELKEVIKDLKETNSFLKSLLKNQVAEK